MPKCENCLHKKDCIDGANFKSAENCERFVPKMSLTQEGYKFASPDGTAYGIDVTDTFEVIGNIHDNPEFLKESEDKENA